ncbi:aspartate/glutamate racemase family protein [Effusibacillus lacus]|uniref:Hydantoin racemase n=1 Tax=Effusibacillus lacus TaxID=1348429 RepID=A0A292YSJ6_9BACL|nr:aspartate/glutamate racemase family protein [Effusibacillus lacus]TCS75866.1 Asp/Glu/hydantoin racemase [Effusibacillus lacus]GAX91743.1 hydantoin racemase [Effusibacillus lacus]
MIGVIRVFTTGDPEILNQHGRIITKHYGIQTMNKCIPDQPLGIFNDETEEIAIPKIVELGKELERNGSQVLVISCAADPGIKELRQAVAIPVIGAGSSAALAALAIGEPVGVLGISDSVPKVVENLLGDLMIGYARPEGVTNTTDLLTPSGREKGVQAARLLMEQGAKAIVFACTGFSTIGLADVLRKEINAVVIDPVEAEGMFASLFYKQAAKAVQN